MGKGYRPIGFNTGFLFASQTLGSIVRAVYAAVLARELGPELFGLMNYGLGWYAAFLAAANLQLESYMSRQVALSPTNASTILSDALTLRTFSTILVFAVAVATAFTSDSDGLLTNVLLIFAVAMVGRSAAMWCSSAFVSRESARHVFNVELAFRVVEAVAGISALLVGFGLVAIALIHALSWWGQSIYGLWLVRSRLSAVHFRPRFVEQFALFRTVLPVAIASIGATWLMQGPFVLFKDKASVAGELGIVALVLQAFVLVTGIPVALGRAALPALSRTVARADGKDAHFLGVVLRAAIPGTTLLIIAAATAGPWIVALIFGEAYLSAGLHLPYGMMLVLPFGVASIANQILVAHDRASHAMFSSVLGALAMSVFVLLLIQAGDPIAEYLQCVIAGMLVWSIAALALLSHCVAVNWYQWLVKPALASGLSLGLFHVLTVAIGPWGGAVAATLLLLAAQRVFNIVDRQEWAALSRRVQARMGRGPSSG